MRSTKVKEIRKIVVIAYKRKIEIRNKKSLLSRQLEPLRSFKNVFRQAKRLYNQGAFELVK